MSEFEKAWESASWHNEKECGRAPWNAALDAAKAKMPDPVIYQPVQNHDRRADGWNNCLSAMDERLDALKMTP